MVKSWAIFSSNIDFLKSKLPRVGHVVNHPEVSHNLPYLREVKRRDCICGYSARHSRLQWDSGAERQELWCCNGPSWVWIFLRDIPTEHGVGGHRPGLESWLSR